MIYYLVPIPNNLYSNELLHVHTWFTWNSLGIFRGQVRDSTTVAESLIPTMTLWRSSALFVHGEWVLEIQLVTIWIFQLSDFLCLSDI